MATPDEQNKEHEEYTFPGDDAGSSGPAKDTSAEAEYNPSTDDAQYTPTEDATVGEEYSPTAGDDVYNPEASYAEQPSEKAAASQVADDSGLPPIFNNKMVRIGAFVTLAIVVFIYVTFFAAGTESTRVTTEDDFSTSIEDIKFEKPADATPAVTKAPEPEAVVETPEPESVEVTEVKPAELELPKPSIELPAEPVVDVPPQTVAAEPTASVAAQTETTSVPASSGPAPVNPIVKQQIIDLKQAHASSNRRIDDLQVQITDLDKSVQSLNSNVVKLTKQLQVRQVAEKKAAVKQARETQQRRAAAAASTFQIRAIVPGRAWLMSSFGDLMTVAEGDRLEGLGTVDFINADEGEITTSSGAIIRYAPSDR